MRLRARYRERRSSYWFLPSVMAAGAVLLAFALVALDRPLQGRLSADGFWVLPASAEGAWAILSTVASSMITVTGVVFSITVVTLSLASQQFGPRLLQDFMRDRHRRDDAGQVRLVVETMDFPEFTAAAFDPLRGYSRGNPSVTLHLLGSLCTIAPFTRSASQRRALLRQAELVEAESAEAFPWGPDRTAAAQACRRLREALAPPRTAAEPSP